MISSSKENVNLGPAPPSCNTHDQAPLSISHVEDTTHPMEFIHKGAPIPTYGVPYMTRHPLQATANMPVGSPFVLSPARAWGGVPSNKQQSHGFNFSPLSSVPVPQDPSVAHTSAVQTSVEAVTIPTAFKTPARPKGKGSRSGHGNRREPGGSDIEVEKLSADQLANASVIRSDRSWTDEQKLLVVKRITSPEVWKEFRSKKAIIFQELSQQTLEKKKTITQVRNLWNRFWLMYKLIRRREEHTGGGDGDDSTEAITDEDDSNSSLDEEKVTKKRKRDSEKPKKTHREQFSHKQLGVFKDSVYYTMIDNVAHDDQTVIRKRAFNPTQPVSDAEDSSPRKRIKKEDSEGQLTRTALRELIAGAKERQLVSSEIARANLDLARRKEERESQQAEEEAKFKYAAQVMQMIDHPNEKVRKIGDALANDLAQKFGVKF